jgi:hypothetical protein
MTDVKKLENGSFKIQVGKFLTSYRVDENNKITIFDKDGSNKSFNFVESDIETVRGVGILLMQIAKACRKTAPAQEIQVNGRKYVLVEATETTRYDA